MSTTDLVRRLIESWSAPHQPGKIRPGASPAEIEALENPYGVSVPLDFLEYLLTVNGMGSDDYDDWITSFWGTDRIQPAATHYPTGQHDLADAEASRYFIFCDIIIECFWYAIRLTSDPTAPSPVVIWGNGEPFVVARSFSEFLEAYLRDPDALPTGMPSLE